MKMFAGNDRKKRIILISAAALIAVFIGGNIIHLKLLERKARDAVEKHLEHIKSGKGNPYETVDVLRVNKILENVSDFLYLGRVSRERVKDKTMVIDRNMYERSFRNSFSDYDEFKDGMKKVYGKKAIQTEDGFIVKRNEHHYQFAFLYDVMLTDKRGQEINKKYVFEVKPSVISNSDYAIIGFYEMKR